MSNSSISNGDLHETDSLEAASTEKLDETHELSTNIEKSINEEKTTSDADQTNEVAFPTDEMKEEGKENVDELETLHKEQSLVSSLNEKEMNTTSMSESTTTSIEKKLNVVECDETGTPQSATSFDEGNDDNDDDNDAESDVEAPMSALIETTHEANIAETNEEVDKESVKEVKEAFNKDEDGDDDVEDNDKINADENTMENVEDEEGDKEQNEEENFEEYQAEEKDNTKDFDEKANTEENKETGSDSHTAVEGQLSDILSEKADDTSKDLLVPEVEENTEEENSNFSLEKSNNQAHVGATTTQMEPAVENIETKNDAVATESGTKTSLQKPELPKSRPNKTLMSQGTDSNSEVPIKKPPPRVPKKPSSKIAAFQEMLQQQQSADLGLLNKATPKVPLKRPSVAHPTSKDSESESSEVPEKVVNRTQSNFAQNLNGLLGVGLPGLALGGNPYEALKAKKAASEEKSASSNDSSKAADSRRSRARGPRGRKLPGEVKKPVELTDETLGNRLTITVQSLWSVEFNSVKSESMADRVEELPSTDVVTGDDETSNQNDITEDDINLKQKEASTESSDLEENVLKSSSEPEDILLKIKSENLTDPVINTEEDNKELDIKSDEIDFPDSSDQISTKDSIKSGDTTPGSLEEPSSNTQNEIAESLTETTNNTPSN